MVGRSAVLDVHDLGSGCGTQHLTVRPASGSASRIASGPT